MGKPALEMTTVTIIAIVVAAIILAVIVTLISRAIAAHQS